MNCACSWPQSPPPASLNGDASGVKKTPVRLAPLPPVIVNDVRWPFVAVAGMSDQYVSASNGPSMGAVQVGGLPVNATEPVPPYTTVWFRLTAAVPMVETWGTWAPR